jgi:hypothetical protein
MEKEKLKISDVLENTTNKRTVGSFEELINGEICYCAMGLIYKKAAQIRNKMIDGIFSATKEVFPDICDSVSLERLENLNIDLDISKFIKKMKDQERDSYPLDLMMVFLNDHCNFEFKETALVLRALGY